METLSTFISAIVNVCPLPPRPLADCSTANCTRLSPFLLTRTSLAKLFSFNPNQIPACCEPLTGVVVEKSGVANVASISITLEDAIKPTPRAFICELVSVLFGEPVVCLKLIPFVASTFNSPPEILRLSAIKPGTSSSFIASSAAKGEVGGSTIVNPVARMPPSVPSKVRFTGKVTST
ncbi:Hypothetical protein I595_3424 [Croceitalea dokdonensis DOKDO 023]|uniref:Uncharacterized protein n=1 Tax=Croceitalea dokdonensis DOKDO 023 TaxID=1300341 RepID=A0A0P7AY96_9FLAO|nr:Hypothetical protein I595_3424 [Croceitalea dokdonensis DOKDO 023]